MAKEYFWDVEVKGGDGSGHFDHAGRPGKVGGSLPSGETARAKPESRPKPGSKPKKRPPAKYVKGKKLKLAESDAYKKYGVQPVHFVDGEDLFLKSILEEQGFNGVPEVVTKEEMDASVHDGDIEIFRGVNGELDNPEKNERRFEEYKSGDNFVGTGTYGNGVYAALNEEVARDYASEGGFVIRMSLRKDARIADGYEMTKAMYEMWNSDLPTRDLYRDEGRMAALLGYDAVKIKISGGEYFYIILNRTALKVQEGVHLD